MELNHLFKGIYKDKTVLVTGHTGFKGSWLAFWLQKMGAKAIGYALKSNLAYNHLDLLPNPNLTSYLYNINDQTVLEKVIQEHRPDIIFHLAAQSIVRYSYQNPVETYQTNLMGSLNIYEVAKNCSSVKAIVSITTDKVYENNEWIWGYRENDRLGGFDPYSASKACVEIMTESYRRSFLKDKNLLLATARAGNVIGGGDWATDRLIPDIITAIKNRATVKIRNPKAIRPWQHVLEPLTGYLQLGQKLLENKSEFAEAWNFAPDINQCIEVEKVLLIIQNKWDELKYDVNQEANQLHEANTLKLDNTKATTVLQWKPIWGMEQTINYTIEWYKSWIMENKIITETQLSDYVQEALKKNVIWTE